MESVLLEGQLLDRSSRRGRPASAVSNPPGPPPITHNSVSITVVFQGRTSDHHIRGVRRVGCSAVLNCADPAALRSALGKAFRQPGPTLIDVPVGEMPSPWGVSQPMTAVRPAQG